MSVQLGELRLSLRIKEAEDNIAEEERAAFAQRLKAHSDALRRMALIHEAIYGPLPASRYRAPVLSPIVHQYQEVLESARQHEADIVDLMRVALISYQTAREAAKRYPGSVPALTCDVSQVGWEPIAKQLGL